MRFGEPTDHLWEHKERDVICTDANPTSRHIPAGWGHLMCHQLIDIFVKMRGWFVYIQVMSSGFSMCPVDWTQSIPDADWLAGRTAVGFPDFYLCILWLLRLDCLCSSNGGFLVLLMQKVEAMMKQYPWKLNSWIIAVLFTLTIEGSMHQSGLVFDTSVL